VGWFKPLGTLPQRRGEGQGECLLARVWGVLCWGFVVHTAVVVVVVPAVAAVAAIALVFLLLDDVVVLIMLCQLVLLLQARQS